MHLFHVKKKVLLIVLQCRILQAIYTLAQCFESDINVLCLANKAQYL